MDPGELISGKLKNKLLFLKAIKEEVYPKRYVSLKNEARNHHQSQIYFLSKLPIRYIHYKYAGKFVNKDNIEKWVVQLGEHIIIQGRLVAAAW